MKHLDLFSGIGGFALAASWVWHEHEVVAFCEQDQFCKKVLKKHWPDVPIYDDIKTFTVDSLVNLCDHKLTQIEKKEICTLGGKTKKSKRRKRKSVSIEASANVDLLTGGFP